MPTGGDFGVRRSHWSTEVQHGFRAVWGEERNGGLVPPAGLRPGADRLLRGVSSSQLRGAGHKPHKDTHPDLRAVHVSLAKQPGLLIPCLLASFYGRLMLK